MDGGWFTLREILSQPEVWRGIKGEVDRIKDNLKRLFLAHDYQKVIFTGCGSSYYLATAVSRIFSSLTGKNSLALPASELLLYPEIYLQKDENYLLVAISRSGESTETVDALMRTRKNYKTEVLGVSCYKQSTLVEKSDLALIISQAKEKSVVMTRSFTSMLIGLGLISCIVAGKDDLYREFTKLPELAGKIIDKYKSHCKKIIDRLRCEKFVYLGSGPFYGFACEGALKMKEMANLSCEVYHIPEYIHGPKSTADEKTMVFLLLPGKMDEYLTKFLQELTLLGCQILVECEKIPPEIEKNKISYVLEMDSGLSDYTRGLLYMIPLQLIAFYNTLKRGLNPDSPRNLSQVVRY